MESVTGDSEVGAIALHLECHNKFIHSNVVLFNVKIINVHYIPFNKLRQAWIEQRRHLLTFLPRKSSYSAQFELIAQKQESISVYNIFISIMMYNSVYIKQSYKNIGYSSSYFPTFTFRKWNEWIWAQNSWRGHFFLLVVREYQINTLLCFDKHYFMCISYSAFRYMQIYFIGIAKIFIENTFLDYFLQYPEKK